MLVSHDTLSDVLATLCIRFGDEMEAEGLHNVADSWRCGCLVAPSDLVLETFHTEARPLFVVLKRHCSHLS